jgi:hypothetical protein
MLPGRIVAFMATKKSIVPWLLGAALVAQFIWWNSKCPNVLRKGGYT